MSCKKHYNKSESPHIDSITVTSGGTGYTWAKATVTGGGGSGARLRCIITDGVITSIEVVHPGREFTSIPTITITGDGSGATAEVALIEGGAQVFENTTTVQDWKPKECDDYRCAYDDSEPPELIEPPELRPDECLITPEPIPICGGGDTPGCDCVGGVPAYLENTYAEKDPPEFVSFAGCNKKGFKVAWSKKEWFGWYGFTDPAPSQTKYLHLVRVVTASMTSSQRTVTADRTDTATTNRYTGLITSDSVSHDACESDPPELGLPCGCIEGLLEETIEDLMENMVPDENGDFPTPPEGWTIDSSVSNDSFEWEATFVVEDAECGNITHVYTSTGTYSVPYTPADVIDDGKELLAMIDLCDDKKYQWRTDIPIHVESPAGHYTPQKGPSFGPLVHWAAGEDDEPVIRGVMNPAGYEPHFDSEHRNQYFDEGTLGGGNYCWQTNTAGAYAPTEFRHATRWMPDLTNNMYLPGSNASYNSAPRQYQTCNVLGSLTVFDAGTLYLSKWAEIYQFDFPHHDDARPCGADVETRDPDTIVCDPEDPEYNPTGDLLFPDAEPCVGSDKLKQGSYSLKSFQYRADAFQSMTCGSGNATFTKCRPTAIFIQDEEPTGIYEGALRIDPAAISFFDDREIDDVPQGDWALVQFYQAMVDPLWKRPASCVEGVKVEDDEAFVPYEENTDCDGGDCTGYDGDPYIAKCEPGAPMPWSYDLEEEI